MVDLGSYPQQFSGEVQEIRKTGPISHVKKDPNEVLPVDKDKVKEDGQTAVRRLRDPLTYPHQLRNSSSSQFSLSSATTSPAADPSR